MKTIIATLQLFLLLILAGCATKYHPPDNSKVTKATAQVKADVRKISDNTTIITKTIKEAQKEADQIAILSTSVSGKVEDIIKIAPPELQPPLALLQEDIKSQKAEEESLSNSLIFAYRKQAEQEVLITQTQTHETDLEKQQKIYQDNAQKLADTTTKLSAKVAWYQWHWWGSWIALGIGVLLCIVFAILKVLGKLPI